MVRPVAQEHSSPVAPHVGAWIEITSSNTDAIPDSVAPHVGAWIEIGSTFQRLPMIRRRSS